MLGWVHVFGKIKPRCQTKLFGRWNAEPLSVQGAKLLISRCVTTLITGVKCQVKSDFPTWFLAQLAYYKVNLALSPDAANVLAETGLTKAFPISFVLVSRSPAL